MGTELKFEFCQPLSWDEITDKLAINWQNSTQNRL